MALWVTLVQRDFLGTLDLQGYLVQPDYKVPQAQVGVAYVQVSLCGSTVHSFLFHLFIKFQYCCSVLALFEGTL